MGPPQGKPRARVVIEASIPPLVQVVTRLASSREAYASMVDGSGVLIILHVARHARRSQPCKHARRRTAVTGFARCNAVRADKRKSIRVMLHRIDLHSPAFYRVAVLARCAKLTSMEVGMA